MEFRFSRVESPVEARILTNFPLKFLYEDWKRVSKPLPGTPFKDTHSWRLVCLASKKYRKTSTDGKMPNCEHKMIKAQINAQLLGYSWAGATLSSVNSSFSKMDKWRHKKTFLKNVA